MKLKKEFISVFDEGSSVTVSTNSAVFSGMIKGNETASLIIKLLKEDTTAEKISESILDQYDIDAETALRDVMAVINRLKAIGAIDE